MKGDAKLKVHPAQISSHALTRRQILYGAAACAATSLAPAAWGWDRASAARPQATLQPVPAGPVTAASLIVSSDPAGFIGSQYIGLSYPKGVLHTRLLAASNTDLVALCRRLGTGVLRIGGSEVDRTVWTAEGPGETARRISPSDVDALASFVKATGWHCLYGVNLGGSATGTTNPALAAEEVAYVHRLLGDQLLGIEIGNEPNLYNRPNQYYPDNWTLAKFIALWREYREAILAVTPGVAITGPATVGAVETWTIPFGKQVGKSEISLLTQHYYRGNGAAPASSAANLMQTDPKLFSELRALLTCSAEIGVPYRMAECNTYYGYDRPNAEGAKAAVGAYDSALWAIDFLFECALGGSVGVNMHSLSSGLGYAPIAFSESRVLEARPEYYGMLLFTLAGEGTLYHTQFNAGDLNATAYAVKGSAGTWSIVVNNKESKTHLRLNIQLPRAARSAALLELTQRSGQSAGPDLMATNGITIQGSPISKDGSFAPGPAYTLSSSGSQFSCYAPALSAVLIQIT